jgi:hypothetical protein
MPTKNAPTSAPPEPSEAEPEGTDPFRPAFPCEQHSVNILALIRRVAMAEEYRDTDDVRIFEALEESLGREGRSPTSCSMPISVAFRSRSSSIRTSAPRSPPRPISWPIKECRP